MGYTKDFKIAVIKFHFSGNGLVKTAKTFSIGLETVVRWKREFVNSGELQRRKVQQRHHLRKITQEQLEQFLNANPNANQNEMAEHFGCKPQSVQVALKKFGYSRKKNKNDTTKLMRINGRCIWEKSPT